MTREVFSYFDGAREVWADPLTIHRRLTRALDGDPNSVLAAIQRGREMPDATPPYVPDAGALKQADDAIERLLPAIREVFAMPFDRMTGQGATEGDCLAAVSKFVAFMEKKTPKNGSPPTSPPPTGPPS